MSLPSRDGVWFIEELRSQGFETPIMVSSGRGGDADVEGALDAGADEYVIKPVSATTLSARVRALARRAARSRQARGRRRPRAARRIAHGVRLTRIDKPHGQGVRAPQSVRGAAAATPVARRPAPIRVGVFVRPGDERRRRRHAPAASEARQGHGPDRDRVAPRSGVHARGDVCDDATGPDSFEPGLDHLLDDAPNQLVE